MTPQSAGLSVVPLPAEAAVLRGRGTLEGAAIVALAMVLWVWGLPWLTRAWLWALQTGVSALNLNALVSQSAQSLPGWLAGMSLPRLSLVGPAATPGMWGSLSQVAVLLAASLALSRWRRLWGPWARVGQAVLALCGLSVVWFGLWPEQRIQGLPQHLAQHTGDLFVFGVMLQCLLPLVLGLTLFPLEGRRAMRGVAVVLTWAYFAGSLPVKLLAHAWLVGQLGAAAMPVLYLCFGPVLDVLLFVALYGWMASWRPRQA